MIARRHAVRGQAVAEFALASAAFLALLFGVVDFAEAMFAYGFVTDAARLGARYAMVRGSGCSVGGCPATSASVRTYVLSKATAIDPSQLTVTTTWANATGCTTSNGAGCVVTVQLAYTYRFVYRLPPVTFTSASAMVISQ